MNSSTTECSQWQTNAAVWAVIKPGSNLDFIIAGSLMKHCGRVNKRKTICFCLFAVCLAHNCHGHGLVLSQLGCIWWQMNGCAVQSCSRAVCRAHELWQCVLWALCASGTGKIWTHLVTPVVCLFSFMLWSERSA